MRTIFALSAFWLLVSSATAQPTVDSEPTGSTGVQSTLNEKCLAVADALLNNPLTSPDERRLYFRYGDKWSELKPSVWYRPDPVIFYQGGPIFFIYVVAPSITPVEGRDFLAVKTAIDGGKTNWVDLKRHQEEVSGRVSYGQYQDYHLNDKFSGVLSAFHTWPNGVHSDETPESRQAFGFLYQVIPTTAARRQVLAIGHLPMANRVSCINFFLGSKTLNRRQSFDGSADFSAQSPFVIEISEAANATINSAAWNTFRLLSEKAPVQGR